MSMKKYAIFFPIASKAQSSRRSEYITNHWAEVLNVGKLIWGISGFNYRDFFHPDFADYLSRMKLF